MQSHNSRRQNSNNRHDDKFWEFFHNLTYVHMWDGFVYLFIVVCDSEDDLDHLMDDFSDLRNKILNLHRHRGASEDKYDKTNEIIDQYLRSRFKKDEQMRHEIMISIFKQLESHNIYEPYLTNMINVFNKMPRYQRKSLREMFLSRIYGYSKFSEYLFKEWNKKCNTMNRNEEEFYQDKKINVKEQRIDQNSDQNKRKSRTKDEKDEDFHQDDKKINVKEQKVDQNTADQNISQNTDQNIGQNTADNIGQNNDLNIDQNTDQNIDQNIDQNKSNSSKADELDSEHEENSTQNKNVEEKKHDYKETTNSSSTNSTNKVSKKDSKFSKRKPKSRNKKENSKVEEMQQKINWLQEEAAKYQAALGGIMNVGWRDSDFNNSMQLTKDIEKLQKDLADFTRVKRGGIVLNNDAVRTLLQNHKCRTQVDSKNVKSVLGTVLQQHLIKFILESADSYFEEALSNIAHFQQSDFTTGITDDKLEAVILSKIKELIELTTRFEGTRIGTDEYSRILPTKLRQQIYTALGHRGFSMSDHPFITQLTKDLINEMNKYRTIESEDKNIKLEKEIITIIIQVLRIFYFRLHTQEPIPSLEFYKSGDCFDPNVMESTSQIEQSQIEQSDEEELELEVEICSFPVVALVNNLEEETKRVFTKAQVIVRPKK